MRGYQTQQQRIAVAGVDDLTIRSLLDRQQFFDPDGDAGRLGISSAAWPMFGWLWPSGAQLAARVAQHPVSAGERILEIGCGLALASLVGHRRGADMTASDCHPLARRFLEANLRLNDLAPMKYRHGHWGGPEALPEPSSGLSNAMPTRLLQGRYDLIIGSDVLYERDPAGVLAAFITDHAAARAEVWIIDPDRSNRPVFSRHMAAAGFVMKEERWDRPVSLECAAFKGRLLVYRAGPRPENRVAAR